MILESIIVCLIVIAAVLGLLKIVYQNNIKGRPFHEHCVGCGGCRLKSLSKENK